LSAPFDLGRSKSRVCGRRLTAPGWWCKHSTRVTVSGTPDSCLRRRAGAFTRSGRVTMRAVLSSLLSPRRLEIHCIPRWLFVYVHAYHNNTTCEIWTKKLSSIGDGRVQKLCDYNITYMVARCLVDAGLHVGAAANRRMLSVHKKRQL
uniref:Histone acetyltransferase n=1 Tax=Mesocestoides corti TaxID=53468 RepID=A0A0R3UCY8_MESCO